ncbi:MAG: type II toxin-antitoxin system prevent-host-death family antitoxin [Oceanicaulis sp.]
MEIPVSDAKAKLTELVRRAEAGEAIVLTRNGRMEVGAVDAAFAADMARAYRRWGQGVHPASLNLGDCFAYALSARQGAPLLCAGADFAQTDIELAIRP